MKKIIIFAIAFISLGSFGLRAQTRMVLLEKESEIIISGTSTVHDWDMTVVKIKGVVDLSPDLKTLESFDNIDISLDPEDIKSHSSIMDKKAYDALQAKKHPSINFKMTSINNLKTEGASFTADIKGVLKVAGKSKEVVLKSSGLFKEDNSLSTSGNVNLKMTDFGISPPTAMMGAMKTGDDINIKFNLTFRTDLKTLTNK